MDWKYRRRVGGENENEDGVENVEGFENAKKSTFFMNNPLFSPSSVLHNFFHHFYIKTSKIIFTSSFGCVFIDFP